MYELNFTKLITDLLAWFLRKPVQLAWLECLLKPLADLHALFTSVRTNMLFDANITGQVCYLEYALNSKVYNDGSLRTIYITDDSYIPQDVYLYQKLELEDETYIFNAKELEDDTYLFNSHEGSGGYDFVVHIPTALTSWMATHNDYFIALIKKYKMAGPSFKVQYY